MENESMGWLEEGKAGGDVAVNGPKVRSLNFRSIECHGPTPDFTGGTEDEDPENELLNNFHLNSTPDT